MDLESIVTVANGAIFLGSISMVYASWKLTHPGKGKNVIAVVPINGTISDKDYPGKVTSRRVIQSLEKLCKNPKVKGIIFDINSGGGSPYQSREIAKYIKKKVNVPNVTVARSICASGAYMIASATDYIFGEVDSSVGSVGVIGVHIAFGGMLEKLGIKYNVIKVGKHKDMHLPLKELTEEQESIMRSQAQEMYNNFVDYVSMNRVATLKHNSSNIDYHSLRQHILNLATGETYLANNAYKFGLIDGIGSTDEAVAYLEDRGKFKHSGIYDVKSSSSPFSRFGMSIGISLGNSIAESVKASLFDDY